MLFKINKACYCVTLILKCTISSITKKQQSYFISKTVSRPDLSKVKGEDAYFTINNHLGVFDGVGGWRESGIDVSKFSELLADSTKQYCKTNHVKDNAEVDLVAALTHGLNIVKQNQVTGSSTACLVSMNSITKQSNILNLGDSGAMIFRPNIHQHNKLKLVFETKPQCHSFNFPFQTGNISDELLKKGEYGDFDSPQKADMYAFQLQRHDVVLLASDGLFDNLFVEEINDILNKYLVMDHSPAVKAITDTAGSHTQQQPQQTDDVATATATDNTKSITYYEQVLDKTVNELVKSTLTHSLDTKRASPFSVGYTEAMQDKVRQHPHFHAITKEQQEKVLKQYEHRGGKPDDITVILGMVVTAAASDSQDRD